MKTALPDSGLTVAAREPREKEDEMDLEKIKKRFGELQTGSYFTPKPGQNRVRFLPPKEPTDVYYREVYVHWNVGPAKQMVLCLAKSRGQRCFICEQIAALRAVNDPARAPHSQALAEDMQANYRAYYNIIDLGGDVSKPLVFSSGSTIFKGVMAFVVDPDWGDVTNPQTGFDMVIERQGTDINTDYTVRAVREPSALKDMSILEKMRTLDEIIADFTFDYEQQKGIFEGTAGNTRTRAGATASAAPLSAPTKSVPPPTAGVSQALGSPVASTASNDEMNVDCFGRLFKDGDEICDACGKKAECKEVMFPKPQRNARVSK